MYKNISVSSKAQGLILVPIHSETAGKALLWPKNARAHDGCQNAVRAGTFMAEAGATCTVGTTHMLVGLGPVEGFSADRMRTVGAKVGRALDKISSSSIAIDNSASWGSDAAAKRAMGGAFAEGISLGTWRFDALDGTATKREARKAKLTLWADDAAVRDGFAHGLIIADGVNTARRIGATPPNIANPSWIAAESKKIARDGKMKVRVINYAQARKLGMGGLTSVGQGSAIKPCIVVIEWTPRKFSARNKSDHLVLVGKTVTYDTGGYSLKVNNGMKGMKYDKCGGAAVLGAMQTIAALKVPMRVTGILAVAENMVSNDSYRPDDIIKLHNGITVEVTNTDAEGRLVLADALSWACDTMKPSAIVDIATLTGGVGVALGHFCAGYFCNQPNLAKQVEDSATSTGELVWRLPLWPEHQEFMRSQHADILNSNPLRAAHPIQGAAFLSYFVKPEIPWAHLDIAAMATAESANEVTGGGPTGWGVRLLVDMVEQRS